LMGQKTSPNFDLETKMSGQYRLIAGVDEVGRGALAGPIVAAAVIFKNYEKVLPKLSGINDSKMLTPLKRLAFDEIIKEKAFDFNIALVEASEIDKIGIGAANITAFKKAISGLKKCQFVLIDGRRFHGFDYPYLCIEKGDSQSFSIASASIIAKLYRDTLMQEIHEELYRYDFASNKGYGSASHIAALRKYGPSRHHRKSFLRKFEIENSQKTLL